MVMGRTKSSRWAVAGIVTALLLAKNCFADLGGESTADCEKKVVEEVYGTYVYDELRLRPISPLKLSVEETYGDYKPDEAPGTSWSELSQTEARSFTGLEVSIEPARFQRGGNVVVDPHYETRCYEHVAGRFPFQPWSEDNVFGWDRAVVDVLAVFQKNDGGRRLRVAEFEIVGDDLWIRDRSWLFVVRRKE